MYSSFMVITDYKVLQPAINYYYCSNDCFKVLHVWPLSKNLFGNIWHQVWFICPCFKSYMYLQGVSYKLYLREMVLYMTELKWIWQVITSRDSIESFSEPSTVHLCDNTIMQKLTKIILSSCILCSFLSGWWTKHWAQSIYYPKIYYPGK